MSGGDLVAPNATAKRDFACTRCGKTIRSGERCLMFRERATSSAEARNAGTLYPWRKWCASCVAARAAKAGAS